MRTEEIRNEIKTLELSEKLLLVEDLWDSIAASNAEIPPLRWQARELNTRYQEYKKGRLEQSDWRAVHDELRAKYK